MTLDGVIEVKLEIINSYLTADIDKVVIVVTTVEIAMIIMECTRNRKGRFTFKLVITFLHCLVCENFLTNSCMRDHPGQSEKQHHSPYIKKTTDL